MKTEEKSIAYEIITMQKKEGKILKALLGLSIIANVLITLLLIKII